MTGVARAPDPRLRRGAAEAPPWGDLRAERPGSGGGRSVPAKGRPSSSRGIRLAGLGAVAFIFAVTVAVATAESLLGVGLRTLTLGALVGSTLLAGLWVRRSDLATIMVAPPLVFAVVAALEIGLELHCAADDLPGASPVSRRPDYGPWQSHVPVWRQLRADIH